MTPWIADALRVLLIGIAATALMDVWLLLLKLLRVPTLPFAFIGRWAGHLARGRWKHEAIAKSAPVAHERLLGWATHYAVGIAFAAVLVALWGMAWVHKPTLAPALAVGMASVLAPWCVMQPSMGAGVAYSKTAAPLRNALRSLATHTVFGAGLYLAAAGIASITR